LAVFGSLVRRTGLAAVIFRLPPFPFLFSRIPMTSFLQQIVLPSTVPGCLLGSPPGLKHKPGENPNNEQWVS